MRTPDAAQMARADELRQRLERRLGTQRDQLSRYSLWLDRNTIPADEDGWPSMDAYDERNIEEFIREELSHA
jgi:hypothetical protein